MKHQKITLRYGAGVNTLALGNDVYNRNALSTADDNKARVLIVRGWKESQE